MTNTSANVMIEEFEDLLRSTCREGIDNVIEQLKSLGFYTAPASTKFHLAEAGGLLKHSLNVCTAALSLREQTEQIVPDILPQLPRESVIIAALLHDVCKADIYKNAIVSKRREDGFWEKVNGYTTDYSHLPLGHGEKSVIMLLSWGLKLTDEEMVAIRWHMTAWDLPFQSPESKANLEAAKARTPLCGLIQCADSFASNIMER